MENAFVFVPVQFALTVEIELFGKIENGTLQKKNYVTVRYGQGDKFGRTTVYRTKNSYLCIFNR